MNFGYLLVVSSSDKADYLKMAYALAMSIKNTQKEGYDSVALVIDDASRLEQLNSAWVFDKVIQWDQETFWDGRSWMDKLTPFDNTVCLDVDMLFTRDYSHWVDYFVENCELYVANHAYNYRGKIAQDDFYRAAFRKNNLPNLYSFYTFFKKDSELANEFFTLGRHIIKYPKEFSNMYLADHKPQVVGTDEAFALSAKLLGIEDQISYKLDFPKVLHLKPMVQSWPWAADLCSNYVGLYINKQAKIKVGNYQQTDIVHYVEKDKITDEVISILEKNLWKN